jgi:hypothetical protein
VISLNNPRHPLTAKAEDSSADRIKRQKALAVRTLFGGKASPLLDFSKLSPTPAIRDDGGTDLSSLSALRLPEKAGPTLAQRLDKLPDEVQRLTREYPTLAIEHLECLGAVVREEKRRQQAVPVSFNALSKAMRTTVEKAEAIVGELQRVGLIRRVAMTAPLPHFVPSL